MLALTAACASTPPVGGASDVQVATTGVLPQPTIDDAFAPTDSFAIRPLDVMQITVFGVEELSVETQVEADGTIDFPLVGTVDAQGLAPSQFSRRLESMLRASYVRDPDVTTRITERADRHVSISGEVTNPGRYPITQPITLMEAVAMSGGLNDAADEEELLVFRTVGGTRYIGVYNIAGIQRGNYADPIVYPDDIVMVGENAARARLARILELTAAITSPLILVERALR